jgi:hypothetical protein
LVLDLILGQGWSGVGQGSGQGNGFCKPLINIDLQKVIRVVRAFAKLLEYFNLVSNNYNIYGKYTTALTTGQLN